MRSNYEKLKNKMKQLTIKMSVKKLIDIIIFNRENYINNLKNFMKRIWNETKNIWCIIFMSRLDLYHESNLGINGYTSNILAENQIDYNFGYKKLDVYDNVIFMSIINIINRDKNEKIYNYIFSKILGNISRKEFNKILNRISSVKLVSCHKCEILIIPRPKLSSNYLCMDCKYNRKTRFYDDIHYMHKIKFNY